MTVKTKQFLFALFLSLCLPTAAVTAYAATEVIYSSIIEDLPLMPGMIEDPAAAVVFDKPGGRIVEITVQTKATRQEIATFYNGTLPSLGWKAAAPSAYVRDNEILVITAGNGTVQFKVSPAEKR